MDVLSDVLKTVRLTGSIFFTADLYDPWSVISPPNEMLLNHLPARAECVSLFHIITEGSCWFKTETGAPFLIGKGSVVIFPHSNTHTMCSSFSPSPVQVVQLLTPDIMTGNSPLTYGGSGDKVQFVCGYLFCDQRFNPLLGAVPEVIILTSVPQTTSTKKSGQGPGSLYVDPGSWLDATVNHLVSEVYEKKPGSATVITRLTELLFVEILRRYMDSLPGNSRGWLAAVRDPEIGRALKYLHAAPAEKWSVDIMADKVGVSRSAFAKRFTDLTGETPIHYLAGWRMQLAKSLLLEPALSLAAVAEKIGYESDIAFNRAFKRHVGTSPAKWREKTIAN